MESRRRSQNKKPPRGNWQPTVPSWEKLFCKVVGALDWGTFMDMKRFVHLYDNIINWDDSAGEEAFHSAKHRFWLHIHGLPYENNLPDPDLYIDKIDWESKLDPELLSDLECKTMEDPDVYEKQETVIIFPDSLMPYHSFSPTGWGEPEEKFQKPPNPSFNYQENPWDPNPWDPNYGQDNPWDPNYGQNNINGEGQGYYGNNNTWGLDNSVQPTSDTGWGTGWDNSWVPTQYDNDTNKVDYDNQKHRCVDSSNNEAWGMWDAGKQNRGNATKQMSRYKVSRFPRDTHQNNNYSWRHGKGNNGEARVWQ